MGRFEKHNPRSNNDPFGAAEIALRAVTEELEIIQRNFLKSLQEDVKRLQTEKYRLAEEIKRLSDEKENLQQARQIADLQVLMRQLAQVMANHISEQLQSSLSTLANQAVGGATGENKGAAETNEQAEKMLGNVDDSLTIAFNVLQQELNNYQSSFSQQLSRMHNQQQQAEAILIELVKRLSSELEKTSRETPPQPAATIELQPTLVNRSSQPEKLTTETLPAAQPEKPTTETPKPVGTPTKLQPDNVSETTTNVSSPPKKRENSDTSAPAPAKEATPQVVSSEQSQPLQSATSLWQQPMGIFAIALSTVVSSLYNVAIKVIFEPRSLIFGAFDVERLISPTLGNTLLILMLRMLVVVPVMSILAPILHPRIWQDLENLIESVGGNPNTASTTARRVLLLSIVSGCFLFLSQVLIYLAIGQVATGMAIALFFIYPMISGLGVWFLFRDRPSSFRLGAIGCVFCGELLILAGSSRIGMGNINLGNSAAIASGLAFALYVILTRICAAKMHPVTFTLINFATMLLLSIVGLIVPLPSSWSLQLDRTHLLELILSAFILGVMTLLGYLLNNFAIRKIGASRSAVFGATVPVLTVIFAGIIIQETLQFVQVFGVLLVTCGAAALGFEKIRNSSKASN